jgi:hypothetical protein
MQQPPSLPNRQPANCTQLTTHPQPLRVRARVLFFLSFSPHQIVSERIATGLETRAKDFNINVEDVSLTQLQFGRAFTAAVEQKQVAEQLAEQARYNVERATFEKVCGCLAQKLPAIRCPRASHRSIFLLCPLYTTATTALPPRRRRHHHHPTTCSSTTPTITTTTRSHARTRPHTHRMRQSSEHKVTPRPQQ